MARKNVKMHCYRKIGLLARPVWVERDEAELIRAAAERAGCSQQEWMRKALLRSIPRRRAGEEE